uniref:BLOC-1-related complex subunit 7 n=1 Tax=Loa loa TaxID=7209 RepID=A0A1I7VNK3_LOALO
MGPQRLLIKPNQLTRVFQDKCQMSIQSLTAVLQKAAEQFGQAGDGKHEELHRDVSKLAKEIQDHSNQKRKQNTGSRDKCMEAISKVSFQLESIRKKLDNIKGNDEQLQTASKSINDAVQLVEKMKDIRQNFS